VPEEGIENITKLIASIRQPHDAGADPDSLFRQLLDAAKDVFAADSCQLIVLNPFTRQVIANATATGENPALAARISLAENSFVDKLLNSGELLVEPVESSNVPGELSFVTSAHLASFLGLPLLSKRRQPLGIVLLGFRDSLPPTARRRDLEQMFAGVAALLLENVWSARRYKEVEAVGHEINQLLEDSASIFEKLKERMHKFIDCRYSFGLSVYQPQAKQQDLMLSEQGEDHFKPDLPLSPGIERVLREGKAWKIDNLHDSADVRQLLGHIEGSRDDISSIIFVPLLFRREPLGVLSVQHPAANAYDDTDVELLQLLGNQVALALSNLRLFDQLRQLNQAGRFLKTQLSSEQLLQDLATWTREIAKADVVTLFPYYPELARFQLPPVVSGKLLADDIPQPTASRSDDVASLTVRQPAARFAKDSSKLYEMLGGNASKRRGNFENREQIKSVAALPLCVGEIAMGAMFVNYRERQRFDAPQKHLIEGLANYAAIAIKSARELDVHAERRRIELSLLQNVDRELSNSLELDDVLKALLEQAVRHIPADAASILLYKPRLEVLEVRASIGRESRQPVGLQIRLGQHKGITRWVFENCQPKYVPNVSADPVWREIYIQSIESTLSELDAPLVDGTEAIGVINLESFKENGFTQQHLEFLVTLAGQVVLAIKNAQAYSQVVKLSKSIISQVKTGRMYAMVLEQALEVTDSTTGSLMLFDPDRNDLWIAAEVGVERDKRKYRQKLGEGVVGQAAQRKEIINADLTALEWRETYLQLIPGMNSELAVPMLEGDSLVGIVNIESPRFGHFSKRDEKLVATLADMAVIALQDARTFRQLAMSSRRLNILHHVGQRLAQINTMADIGHAYDIVVDEATSHFHSQVVLRRYNEKRHGLEVVRSARTLSDEDFIDLTKSRGLNVQVAEERRTLVVDDVRDLPPHIAYVNPTDPKTRSLLVTPIQIDKSGPYFGNLSLSHSKRAHFHDADQLLIEGLAMQLALTIQRLLTLEEQRISQQRARAEKAMNSLGEVARELTHRLKGELSAVLEYAKEAHGALVAADIHETTIETPLANVEQLAVGLLQFNINLQEHILVALKEGIAYNDPETVRGNDLIKEALPAPPVLPEGMRFIELVDPYLPSVHVAPQRIANVLNNVLANATTAIRMKGSNKGNITLRVRSTTRHLIIEVEDDGIGIAPEYRNKIFELFFTTSSNGSGYGLWNARRVAIEYGGEITFSTIPGRGTTFTLKLPIVRQDK
jgi:GAF domain-containing protein